MKRFLRGILTIWIVILLMVFGLVLSLKSIVIDTADNIIKNEIKNNIVSVIENYNDEKISDEVIEEIKNSIENNEEVKKLMNTYFDKIVSILSDKNSNERIDVSSELNNIINDGEKILNDYGITLSSDDKQELLSIVSTEEVNNLVNDTIVEIKSNLNSQTKVVLDIYSFVIGKTFKLILIALIIVTLILIALLKKSYYKWLSNFGTSSITVGIIIGVLIPLSISSILKTISPNNDAVISTVSLKNYGYILIILGLIAIILNQIISKLLVKDDNTTKIDTQNNRNI